MQKNLRLGFISSYVPKKCGIATFSRDLKYGILENYPNSEIFVAALQEKLAKYDYTKTVVAKLTKGSKKSYHDAVEKLNSLKLDAVLLQHEYGLFGGKWINVAHDGKVLDYPSGDHVLELIDKLDAPIITTLHTVIPNPDPTRKDIIQKIVDHSMIVVSMTNDSKKILVSDYQIPKEKIVVIPHGVPATPRKRRSKIIKELNLDEKSYYLVMTGLISDNKGVDLVVKALPGILKKHPNVKLLVVGQTHPQIVAKVGDIYRESLVNLANKLKVSKAVIFVNKYLETQNLMQYISIADIYLTPHRDPEQSASGTLAYAVGTGLITISTPYRYAQELLARGRGFLVPFEDVDGITETVNRLIENAELRMDTLKKLKRYGSKMAWPKVGNAYVELIEEYAD